MQFNYFNSMEDSSLMLKEDLKALRLRKKTIESEKS